MLNTLSDNKGARRKYKRLGRGIGSGKGKTSARGGKGQTARSGVALNGFEGGQMPLYRRLPKRGFKNYTKVEYEVVNLSELQKAIDAKKLNASSITIADLKSCGLFKGNLAVLKVLGTGKLKQKTKVEAHAVSKSLESNSKSDLEVVIVESTMHKMKAANVSSADSKPVKVIKSSKSESKPSGKKVAAPKKSATPKKSTKKSEE